MARECEWKKEMEAATKRMAVCSNPFLGSTQTFDCEAGAWEKQVKEETSSDTEGSYSSSEDADDKVRWCPRFAFPCLSHEHGYLFFEVALIRQDMPRHTSCLPCMLHLLDRCITRFKN